MLPVWLTDTVTSDLDRAVHYTLLWGLEGVELRTVGGPGDRVPFVNEEKLKRRLQETELPVVSVVPGMFEGAVADRLTWLNEVAAFEETLSFCGRIGCSCVVISAFQAGEGDATAAAADALRRISAAAERRDIRVAVLNETSGAHATGAALGTLLDAVNRPNVLAAWSPAAALQAGEDPLAGLKALGGRIALVRAADGLMKGGAWTPKPLGEGGVGWTAQMAHLKETGFDGPVSLEIRLEPAPKHGLHEATRLIELIRKAGTAAKLQRAGKRVA